MALNALARRREGFETEVEIREHRLTVDEPAADGGTDRGPRPTELLAASLASCTTITLVMYADRKGWEVGAVETGVEYTPGTPDSPPKFRTEITIPAELSDEQREKLLVIAGKCPVHRTLAASAVEIEDDLKALGD
jgi:putative redox protein